MNVSKEAEQKISEVQLVEQNIQNLLLQKQNFQVQFTEIDNALSELEKSDDEVYKIVSGLMIKTNKNKLKEELSSRKEVIELRIKNIEKQESKLKEKISGLQKEIMEGIKSDDRK